MSRPRARTPSEIACAAWLTHLARAASGVGAPNHKLVSLALGANRDGAGQMDRAVFAPLAQADARALLAGLAADLLSGVHAYLMPCEGIFTWRRRAAQSSR